jgi:hypothetical protein
VRTGMECNVHGHDARSQVRSGEERYTRADKAQEEEEKAIFVDGPVKYNRRVQEKRLTIAQTHRVGLIRGNYLSTRGNNEGRLLS